MIVKIKDLNWKQLTAFLKNTINSSSKQYKTCQIISSSTRHNKINWSSTYKEAHEYIRPEMLELEINTDTWEIVK